MSAATSYVTMAEAVTETVLAHAQLGGWAIRVKTWIYATAPLATATANAASRHRLDSQSAIARALRSHLLTMMTQAQPWKTNVPTIIAATA